MKKLRFGTACAMCAALLFTQSASSGLRRDKPIHDLGKAEVMDRIILSLLEYYYDPVRFDPLQMFKETVEALQKSVAEIKVSYAADDSSATVEVVDHKITVDLREVTSLWALSQRLRKVLLFLEQHLPKSEYDFQNLEYAAANAMLSTLDPHSNALPPNIYQDFQMETAGEFGGLGIRITTDRRPPCNGKLTVVDVFPETPAKRAGLVPGSQIIRIDGESTVNITVSEAAQRLRGSPGTSVRIVARQPKGALEKYTLVRERIPIDSVKWRMLDDKVGYIELEQFQENSAAHLKKALAELHKQKMKGLILDMRGNPGGLLEIAIKAADLFLDSGTIVATAGREKSEQSVRNASVKGTEPRYPMVVLVDSSSASAAEIIAGSLRNHGRALLVGESTFGKGSVQMVLPLPKGGAFKLTSAQYLIPGDISIQAIGVIPDINFVSRTVDKKEMDLEPFSGRFSEADLEQHLDRPNLRTRADRASAVKSTIYIPAAERQSDRAKFERCFVPDADRTLYRTRYETEFARKLIANARGTTAEELLVQARSMLERDAKTHDRSIEREMKKIGIDWSAAPNANPTAQKKPDELKKRIDKRVTASARIVGKVAVGKELKLKVTVKNGSDKPIYRLRAVTESDNHQLDSNELVFGKLKPGRAKSWTVGVKLSPLASARVDPVKINFKSQAGPLPKPAAITVEVPKRAEPRLAYNWFFEDLGNGNGAFEPGEEVLVHVSLRNTGKGETIDTEARISAKPGVDVVQGRFVIGKLKPNQSAEGHFRLKISRRFNLEAAELDLTVEDWLRERFPTSLTLLHREIDLPVSPLAPGLDSATGAVTIAGDSPAVIREGPSAASRIIGTARAGSSFAVDGIKDGYFRAVSGEGKSPKSKHIWIAKKDTVPGGNARSAFAPTLIAPPVISIEGPRVRRVGVDKVRVKGVAQHPKQVRDLMVFVGDRKVLYLPNHDKRFPDRIAFDVEAPLEKGVNHVTVVTRFDDKVLSSEQVFVRRD